MLDPWKKLLSLALALSMLASIFCIGALAAGEGEEERETEDPYVYEYVAGQADLFFSYSARKAKPPAWDPDQYDVTQPDQLSTSVWYGDYDVTRHHPFRMYELQHTKNEGERVVAYCSDFMTSAVLNHLYKRVNLEDSTYFNETTAAYVRGVLLNGYWVDWTEDDLKAAEKAANAWLDMVAVPAIMGENEAGEPVEITPAVRNKDKTPWNPPENISGNYPGDAEDPVEKISGLTMEEAQAATQMAIWGITYDQFPYWVDFVMSGEENGTAGNGETAYVLSEPSPNIQAFRKYLLHQTVVPMTREDVVFSNDYFVEDSAVFTTESTEDPLEISYDISLRFKLAGELDARDQLNVTAVLGTERQTCALDALPVDDAGYHTVTFQNVAAGDHQIKLELSGTQYVEGVYFYQAKPVGNEDERSTTQNLVGKAQGSTPITAEATIEFSAGEAKMQVYKIDADAEVPVSGAVFSLYADIGKAELLVKEELITDENGYTEVVEGLPADYSYYFVEERAPEGYVADSTRYPVRMAEEVSVVSVKNERKEAALTISKQVSGVPTDQEFTFRVVLDLRTAPLGELYIHPEGENGTIAVLENRVFRQNEDGEFTLEFTLRDGEEICIGGIPAGTEYTVTELDGDNLKYAGEDERVSESAVYVSDPDSAEGMLNRDETVSFTNELYAETQLQLQVKKTIDGRSFPAKTSPFTFQLSEYREGVWTPLQSVKNEEDGMVSFDPVAYTKPGVYLYRISEKQENRAYQFAEPIYAEVRVEARNGVLTTDQDFYAAWGNGQPSHPITEELPVLNNTTKRNPTSTVTKARWSLEGKKMLDGMPVEGFSFAVKDEEGNIVVGKSDEKGRIDFPTYSYGEEGIFTYTVYEVNDGQENIVYDEHIYTVTVTIGKRGSNFVVEDQSIECNGQIVEEVVFRNKVKSEEPSVPGETDLPETEPPEETDLPETELPEEKTDDSILGASSGNSDPTEQTPKEDSPLAHVPVTGDPILLWLMAACLSGLGLILLARSKKKE